MTRRSWITPFVSVHDRVRNRPCTMIGSPLPRLEDTLSARPRKHSTPIQVVVWSCHSPSRYTRGVHAIRNDAVASPVRVTRCSTSLPTLPVIVTAISMVNSFSSIHHDHVPPDSGFVTEFLSCGPVSYTHLTLPTNREV